MKRCAALLMLVSLAACGGPLPPALSATQAAQTGYTLDSGDKLRITVYGEQALTGEYSVGPDGNVSFPLVGSVPTKGQTPEQLAQALIARLGNGYINDPRVAVEVLNYRPYYIFGEVARPGEYPFVNGRSIEQAIAAAGGYTYRGNEDRVTLRRGQEGERLVTRDLMTARVTPGDTIRVGERYF
ncbi:polysaccharide biosynthesis/export family protein [Sphingomonas aracearum]|uniref:Polysaccharide export protein n=1 Tax=Sphingomonas aracearum TaxID=2283317 RepID=A0A369VSC6_9SPHN|nr:polysaccharide biosynthesis/export family protein [Sphingomonas aracearum]RDE05296.1 polysaccharide export protein [Sphingomonas aracearum]